MPEIELKGETVNYSARVSRRAKRISIRFSQAKGLEVVYPAGPKLPTPETLLREREAWVLSTLAKFRKALQQLPAREYQAGETFLILGVAHTLRLMRDPGTQRIQVSKGDGTLDVLLPGSIEAHAADSIRAAVIAAYRHWAKEYLPGRVLALAKRYGFFYQKISIKHQKTRWGSCSAKGNINLNLRLMMAPAAAVDYVIMHELCHTLELHHGPAFWALVEAHCPDYRRWRRWFKQNGAGLIL